MNSIGRNFVVAASSAIKLQRADSGDAEDFTRADDAFHRTLAGASGIPQLWAVIEREKAQFDRIRFLSLPKVTPVATLIKQHETILDGIIRKDLVAAVAAMRAHMSEVLKIARRLASANPDLIVDILRQEQSRRKANGDENWRIPFRPDHGHELLDDIGKGSFPGYSTIGRLKGLAEIRGVMTALAQINGYPV